MANSTRTSVHEMNVFRAVVGDGAIVPSNHHGNWFTRVQLVHLANCPEVAVTAVLRRIIISLQQVIKEENILTCFDHFQCLRFRMTRAPTASVASKATIFFLRKAERAMMSVVTCCLSATGNLNAIALGICCLRMGRRKEQLREHCATSLHKDAERANIWRGEAEQKGEGEDTRPKVTRNVRQMFSPLTFALLGPRQVRWTSLQPAAAHTPKLSLSPDKGN